MRKFRNKKLASALVVFLLVFIMAGAFAMFQTILDIRGRVNMYAPTVDAIISNLTPIAAPLGLLNEVPDPNGVHTDGNAELRGPWLADALTPIGVGTDRFNDRVFFDVPWAGHAGGHLEITQRQSLAGTVNLANVAGGWVSGTAATAASQRLIARNAAWWAWGHNGGIGENTEVDDLPFMMPAISRVALATITEPGAFETLYLNLSFDNFAQFYAFNLELANVGVVPLEVVDVTITRVDDPTAEDPAWEVAENDPHVAALTEMLQAGTMHPAWEGILGATGMAGQTFNVSGGNTYTVDDAAGMMGLVNVTVDMENPYAGGVSGYDVTDNIVIIPIRDSGALGGGNTIDIGLRFCVALENWDVFLDGWEIWGDAVVGLFGGTTGLTGQELLDELLDILFDNALSGTYQIEYTVVPYADPNMQRHNTGVLPAGWPN